MKKPDSILFATLTIALVLRVLFFIAVVNRDPQSFFQPDSYSYWQLGSNLARNHVFSSSAAAPFIPETFRTPGYPLFIAFLQTLHFGVSGIILVQILLSLCVCLLAMLLARDLSGGSVPAVAAAGFFTALDIPSIVFSNTLLTETLFTFFLLAGIISGVRYLEKNDMRLPFISGIFLGLGTLCRPIGFLLPFFLSAALFAIAVFTYRKARNIDGFRRAGAGIALFLLAFGATLAPWLLRNDRVFGFPFISTIGYDSLLYVQGAGVVSVAEDIPYKEAQKRLEERFNRQYGSLTSLRNITRAKAALASEILAEHPSLYARNYIIAIGNMLFRPLRSDIDVMLGLRKTRTELQAWGGDQSKGLLHRFMESTSGLTVFLCVVQVVFLCALYVLFARGLYNGIKSVHSMEVLFITAAIAYFCLTAGAPETYARFRMPIVPLLSVIAALGLRRTSRALSHKPGSDPVIPEQEH